ncbi:MAG: hypothetical protein CR962_00875 [Gammaproteobacteria bacterium]|nr:MAG: hypothetical protein CR962_00875 [Gammaproteobacteria bacterium]
MTNLVPTPEQLQQLKDITLPPQISWWPPALGWQILIALAMLLILAGLWYYYRYKTRLKRTALQALQSLPPSVYKDSTILAAEVSALLRRVTIQQSGNQIATLHGTAWRTYLTDKQLPDEIADFLANAPYTMRRILSQRSPRLMTKSYRQRGSGFGGWLNGYNGYNG